jgi:hypothetical protein
VPELLWESELPAGAGAARFQLYRVADGSLHLTVDEGYGANLTRGDLLTLVPVLALAKVPGGTDDSTPAGD